MPDTHMESLLKKEIQKLTNDRTVLEEIVESQTDQLSSLVQRVVKLTQERDEARRDVCEFGAMLEIDADPDYDPESGKFAEIAMSIAHLKGWDCWSDYKKDI